MFNLHSSVDQRKKKKPRTVEKINKGLGTDLYSLGFFDGLIGSEPSQPERNSYWSGYQIGNREYWAKKLGVLIPSEA